MRRLLAVGLFLVSELLATAQVTSTINDGVVDNLEELRDLFEEHQSDWIELALPGTETLFQSYGLVVPFRANELPKAFRLVGEYNQEGIPVFRITCIEDYFTRQTVIYDTINGTELWRMDADPYHDPYAYLRLKYDLSALDSFDGIDPWEILRLDSAKIAADFTLVPDAFYADYILAEEQRRIDETAVMPMMMAMSVPNTNPVVRMSTDSNSVVTMSITLPETFGEHVEVFSCDNLIYFPWQISKSWLPTYGNTNIAWIDPDSGNKNYRYYIISDADDDEDGDGYSRLREEIFEKNGNGPDVFDYVDSDGDGMHDWYEIKLFGNLNQSGTNDFDEDGLLNHEEMVFTSSGGTTNVILSTDPSLYDTDGDGMDDGLESTYSFLDPLDPSDGDYDHDGLNNMEEHNLGTALDLYDTDDDTLSDGYEVKYNLVATVADDLNTDLDSDGLTLSQEYKYDTDPGNADTDGDFAEDGAEIYQGSSPTSSADSGQAPSSEDTLNVVLEIGDDFTVANDQFEMVVSGERTIRILSGEEGEGWTRETNTFRKGESYTIRVNLADPFGEQVGDIFYASLKTWAGVIYEDPDSVFGSTRVDPDIEATMHIVKVTVSNADYIGEKYERDIYATAAGSDDILISLNVEPKEANVPGFIWDGGLPGANLFERILPASVTNRLGGDYVTATFNSTPMFEGKMHVFPGKPDEADLDIDATIVRNDEPMDPDILGRLDRSGCRNPTNTYRCYYENKEWKFVFEKVEPYMEWGLNSTAYQTDIPDGTIDPFPLGAYMNTNDSQVVRRAIAILDFTPDAKGYIKQFSYWASPLVVRHEQFHRNDWPVYYYPQLQIAESNIETQVVAVTVNNLSPSSVLNGNIDSFNQIVEQAYDDAVNEYKPGMITGGAEDRAYADGKSSYEALVLDIQGN